MTPPKIPRLPLHVWEIVTLEKAMRNYLPYVDEQVWAMELLKKLQGCDAVHFTMRRDRIKKKPVLTVADVTDKTSDV